MLWTHPSLYSTAFPIVMKMIHSYILQLQQMVICLSIVLAKVVGYCLMPPSLFDQAEINDFNSWFESTQTIIRAAGIKITIKSPASSWNQCNILSKQRAWIFSVFLFQLWSVIFPWSRIHLRGNGFDTKKDEEWRLFIDSSKQSLSWMSNRYGSILIWQ